MLVELVICWKPWICGWFQKVTLCGGECGHVVGYDTQLRYLAGFSNENMMVFGLYYYMGLIERVS